MSAPEHGADMAGEGLLIRPAAGMWPLLLGREPSAESQRFREQLGLPTDRPVVMTGHQAQFWHPGILAKYLAADACAGEGQAAVAFIVVDQDRPSQATVRYPVIEPLGNLGVRGAVFSPEGVSRQGARDEDEIPEFVRSGLGRIHDALAMHADEPVFARRIALALRELMGPLLGEAGRSAAVLFATDLCRTELFAELVRRMAREPEGCIGSYNAAASRYPEAGIRALEANAVQDRWELPLWHLPERGPRRHVFAEDIGRLPMHELAPKALFMTGLLRLGGCDLFIHGLGGGGDGDAGYDRITDEWLREWLGREPPAPITVVTATRHLPLAVSPPPGAREIAGARWRLHHAMHHPGHVGLSALEAQRMTLAAEIAAATPHVRAELFRELHTMLGRYRQEHAREVEALRLEVERTLARRGDGQIIADRTWAFPLYPPDSMMSLRDTIRARFAHAGARERRAPLSAPDRGPH